MKCKEMNIFKCKSFRCGFPYCVNNYRISMDTKSWQYYAVAVKQKLNRFQTPSNQWKFLILFCFLLQFYYCDKRQWIDKKRKPLGDEICCNQRPTKNALRSMRRNFYFEKKKCHVILLLLSFLFRFTSKYAKVLILISISWFFLGQFCFHNRRLLFVVPAHL